VVSAAEPRALAPDLFPDLSADEEAALEETLLAINEEARTATVLVVAAHPATNEALRRATATLGHPCFAVTTPLEAACALKQPNRFALVIVDAGLANRPIHRSNPTELLSFLTQQHSRLRCVLLASELVPDGAVPSGASPGASVHGWLRTPWSSDELLRVLEP
jgi:CheY-like chemotaxis protein